MTNPSTQTNPLDYPRYVRSIRPTLPESLGHYVEAELDKVQNSMENLAVASDVSTTAKVSVEAIERAEADATLASLVTSITADFDDVSAAIVTEATARADADTALASQITTVSATAASNTTAIATNAAAITTEATARANGDSANASSISTLSTTVGGHTATLSTYGSSISGLQAKAGVNIDVNGHVTGYEILGTGTTGSFIIRADRFAVVTDTGTDQTAVFEVVGGTVKINGAELKSDSVPTAALPDQVVTGAKVADLTIPTGKIQDGALSDWGTYSSAPGTMISGGVFTAVGSVALDTKSSASSGVQVVEIIASISLSRFGGSMDTATVRCLKSGGSQVGSSRIVDVPAERVSHGLIFIDTAPAASSTITYTIEIQNNTGSPYLQNIDVSGKVLSK